MNKYLLLLGGDLLVGVLLVDLTGNCLGTLHHDPETKIVGFIQVGHNHEEKRHLNIFTISSKILVYKENEKCRLTCA